MIATAEAPPAMSATALYAHLSPAERYIHRTRDVALLELLAQHGVDSLAGRRIIEIGCAHGALIRSLIHYGADPALVQGVDISAAGLAGVRAGTSVASAAALPYRVGAFDLAFMFTSLSSMREDATRASAASEALRVLRPGGVLVVYDFRTNPTNRGVAPISERALNNLFPSRHIYIQRVTLAPPIVRALGGNEQLCRPLERIPLLRTHLLAAIEKEAP